MDDLARPEPVRTALAVFQDDDGFVFNEHPKLSAHSAMVNLKVLCSGKLGFNVRLARKKTLALPEPLPEKNVNGFQWMLAGCLGPQLWCVMALVDDRVLSFVHVFSLFVKAETEPTAHKNRALRCERRLVAARGALAVNCDY